MCIDQEPVAGWLIRAADTVLRVCAVLGGVGGVGKPRIGELAGDVVGVVHGVHHQKYLHRDPFGSVISHLTYL